MMTSKAIVIRGVLVGVQFMSDTMSYNVLSEFYDYLIPFFSFSFPFLSRARLPSRPD